MGINLTCFIRQLHSNGSTTLVIDPATWCPVEFEDNWEETGLQQASRWIHAHNKQGTYEIFVYDDGEKVLDTVLIGSFKLKRSLTNAR